MTAKESKQEILEIFNWKELNGLTLRISTTEGKYHLCVIGYSAEKDKFYVLKMENYEVREVYGYSRKLGESRE